MKLGGFSLVGTFITLGLIALAGCGSNDKALETAAPPAAANAQPAPVVAKPNRPGGMSVSGGGMGASGGPGAGSTAKPMAKPPGTG
jgi:hypothetical protein